MKTGKILIVLLLTCLQGALTAFGVSVLTQNYQYDENGRLVAVTVPENPLLNERYRYDGSGNLVEKQLGERIYRMSYDGAHQLKSQEGPEGFRAFYYDKAGRLVRETLEGKTVAEYRYGYLDKVVEVTRNGERAEFFYDGQGMLAGKRVNGEYEAWTWDGLALIARGDERYVNEGHISGGVPVLSRSREGVRYHQTDILGTTLATYTVDGKMEPVLASAFGAEMGVGSLSGTHRFTGKPYDRHLGAHVFPYRNYDATVARWRSSDPAGFPDGPNGHFYAPVPTMGLDPWGLAVQLAYHSGSSGSGSLGNHLKIVVIPDNPTEVSTKAQDLFQSGYGHDNYFTIGAGPENFNIFNWGNLEWAPNRPTDMDLGSETTIIGIILPSEEMNDTQFVNILLETADKYQNDASYQPLPNGTDTFNSNSFISGLLDALGVSVPEGFDPSMFPGFEEALLAKFFEK